MKNLLLLCIFMTLSARAETAILVATPSLAESVYQEILAEHKDLLSPLQVAIAGYQDQGTRDEIFNMADQCFIKNRCQSFAKNFEKFRQEKLISPQERQLLLELWKKTGKSTDCYWQPEAPCKLQKVSLEKLGLDKDQSYVIFIDGIIYKSGEEISLLPQRKYQWKMISPRYQEKTAWATIDEIQTQMALGNPYVTGGCLANSAGPGLNKDSAANMFVAFDRTCVRKLGETYSVPVAVNNESWIEKNKIWLVSALAITVGAGYYMRDKQVEFSSPFK